MKTEVEISNPLDVASNIYTVQTIKSILLFKNVPGSEHFELEIKNIHNGGIRGNDASPSLYRVPAASISYHNSKPPYLH